MASWNNITHNVRESLDHLTEGWQELWHKARNSITHFSPNAGDNDGQVRTSWGVLSAEVQETENSVELSLEAPGMNSEDFDIRVDGQVLHITGKRSFSSERKDGHYHITERAYGSFGRSLPLPCEVDEEKAKASYKRGVLEVSLPKAVEIQPRRITVASR